MKTNVKVTQPPIFTHEGAKADKISVEAQLRRSVMACMLWEDEFYESGVTIAERIAQLVPQVHPRFAGACAVEARTAMKLRHVSLLIVREMARHSEHKALVGKLLPQIIQRADELSEFLAIYWKDNAMQPVSAQVKKGLRAAFDKFSAFDLAKYNRDGAVKLRDVVFLTHVKADDEKRGQMIAQLVNKSFFPLKTKASGFPVQETYKLGPEVDGLETPDTWETKLSAGEDKKATFERLMAEGKLGALAFLRNLRNMHEAKVDRDAMRAYGLKVKVERVLPFRFITAARIVPLYEDVLEPMMLACMESKIKLPGRTHVLVDVSSSMDQKLSAKSETSRMDAAVGLAVLAREMCEQVAIYSFSNKMMGIAPRRGFALSDAIKTSQEHCGTYLLQSVKALHDHMVKGDRLIVISDEQAEYDGKGLLGVPDGSRYYMVNVASAKNGIGYTKGWVHLDGFSEAILDYIQLSEAEADAE